MTNLLSEPLQKALCRILFGDELPEHLKLVVPLQGNFLNPQQLTADKMPSAYFTYYTPNTTKKLLNHQNDEVITACVVRDVELSCIGKDAEELMLNTLFWDERLDVADIFSEYGSVLMNTPRNIFARPFYQHGENTILQYSTVFKLSTSIELRRKPQYWEGDGLILSGGLIVEA